MSYDLTAARRFIDLNGRLLERRLAAHHFDVPDPDGVRAALAAYQSSSGLFGHALEPDKRSAAPQPIDQEEALRVLDQIGPQPDELSALCDRLAALTQADGGLPFSHPSVETAPHAPWWSCPDPQPSALNPTAAIAGLMHKHGVQHIWCDRATAFCWDKLAKQDEVEMHSLRSILIFLSHVPDREAARRACQPLLGPVQAELARAEQEDGYRFGPVDFAATPGWASEIFTPEQIARSLDQLEARQQPDGGWSIPWPSISPGVELESRGKVTLAALLSLRAYGR